MRRQDHRLLNKLTLISFLFLAKFKTLARYSVTVWRSEQRRNQKRRLIEKFLDFFSVIATAIHIIEKNKGKITNHENSGTVGVGVFESCELVGLGELIGACVGFGVVITVLMLGALGLGAVRKGTKLTVPKLKSFLKS